MLSPRRRAPSARGRAPLHSRRGEETGVGDILLLVEIFVDLLTWLIVGLVAGLLASFAVGGIGYGLIGDIVVGIVGAVFGGWLFGALGVSVPLAGLAGTILVAFIGAVVFLLLLRMIRPGRRLTA